MLSNRIEPSAGRCWARLIAPSRQKGLRERFGRKICCSLTASGTGTKESKHRFGVTAVEDRESVGPAPCEGEQLAIRQLGERTRQCLPASFHHPKNAARGKDVTSARSGACEPPLTRS